MINLSKYRTQFFFLILIFVLSATFVTIKFAKGYKIDFIQKAFVPNGILSINSNPLGAKVLINGKLKTATNNTLSLAPGKYWVEVKKSGFITWNKKLQIEKELVTFADAFLFPEVPDLKPLTFNSALNPKISPDAARIVYSIPMPSPDAGLWVIDLTDSLLVFSKPPKQIAKSNSLLDFSQEEYNWTLDGRQILAEISSQETKYLLDPNQLNTSFVNISQSLAEIQEKWQKEEELKDFNRMKKVPDILKNILEENADLLTFSPDNTKILYLATGSAEISSNLIPPVVSASTQTENRKLEPNKLYVYDIKEDRNFEIPFQISSAKSADQIPQWFPTSRHLIWIDRSAGSGQAKVVSCEYDGANLTTIYSGSFTDPYVFVTPNSSKLVILAEIDFSIGDNPMPTQTLKKTPSPTPAPSRPKTNLFSVSFR